MNDSIQPSENPRVLLVDDEANILNGYKRIFRQQFTVLTASGGVEALQILKSEEDIPVIITDMRMPEMDGLELLKRVKVEYPEMIRIMLTGNADQQTAIIAINEGEIFRFHTKPCTPEVLAQTITQGMEQYRLQRVEQDLLQNTLRGTVQALTEILSLVNPEAFGRTLRITQLTVDIARCIGMKNVWFLETLAMLSQIGCIILPDEVLSKVYKGAVLSEEHKQLFEMHPAMGADVISKIPRMEAMAEGLLYQMKNFDGSGVPVDGVKGEKIPVGGRILRVVIDFDNYQSGGLNKQYAFARLQENKRFYDPYVLKSLRKVLSVERQIEIHKIEVKQLREGMTIVEDVKTTEGTLIINKGHKVSQTLLERIGIFSHQHRLLEPIFVTLPTEEENPEE